MGSGARLLHGVRRPLAIAALGLLIVFAHGVMTGAESEGYLLLVLVGLIWLAFLLTFAQLLHRDSPGEIPVRGAWARLRWRLRILFAWALAAAIVALAALVILLSFRAVGLLLDAP